MGWFASDKLSVNEIAFVCAARRDNLFAQLVQLWTWINNLRRGLKKLHFRGRKSRLALLIFFEKTNRRHVSRFANNKLSHWLCFHNNSKFLYYRSCTCYSFALFTRSIEIFVLFFESFTKIIINREWKNFFIRNLISLTLSAIFSQPTVIFIHSTPGWTQKN